MKELTAISLFSGCGGFDYGASQAGVKFLWANDIDPAAGFAYRSLFPDVEFHVGDVREVRFFPKADVLIGCYPCTGFSLAARRKWKTRARRDLMDMDGNFLYREFLRVLGQSDPRYFFVENVRGMVSAEKGWFFEQQIKGFKDAGYSVIPQLLRAPDYGLPQERRRVFIVGIRKDVARKWRYAFTAPTHGPGRDFPYSIMRDAIGDMPLWPEGEFLDYKFHGHYLTRNRKRGWNSQSFTIVANASHVPLHPHGEPMSFVAKDLWRLNGDFNRRLSWRECARLQGLPDHISPRGNLHDHYRVIGNAVPPVFGKALLEPVLLFENS
ncbi:MAG: DNA cytosine methyltransferase [Desulfovibrio sp.]|jgi:DNA (cytosine-5)-methyltransferase 1|nr:DNA cytosine methyltransferase [Desulfovibrio sp.]